MALLILTSWSSLLSPGHVHPSHWQTWCALHMTFLKVKYSLGVYPKQSHPPNNVTTTNDVPKLEILTLNALLKWQSLRDRLIILSSNVLPVWSSVLSLCSLQLSDIIDACITHCYPACLVTHNLVLAVLCVALLLYCFWISICIGIRWGTMWCVVFSDALWWLLLVWIHLVISTDYSHR